MMNTGGSFFFSFFFFLPSITVTLRWAGTILQKVYSFCLDFKSCQPLQKDQPLIVFNQDVEVSLIYLEFL